jgi:hypothetical protein
MSFDTPGIRHSFWQGPWHYCGICDKKTHIKDMKWQRGVLRCLRGSCYDTWPLPGQREIAIDAVLSDGKEEYAPVEKLRNPTEYEEAEDFIL